MKFTFEQDVEETKAQEESAAKVVEGFFSMIGNIVEKVAVPLIALEQQKVDQRNIESAIRAEFDNRKEEMNAEIDELRDQLSSALAELKSCTSR